MSLATRAAAPQAPAAAPGRRRASSLFASTSSRASNRRLRASAEEVTPDGVFDSAPEGIPAAPAEPPTPARAAVTAPLACPVSLRALDARGFATQSGLKYEQTDGVWNLTIGAAANARADGPVSLTEIARSFLPKELKGLLPESSYLGTSTFETPQVAFAYERGWRDSFKRSGFPGIDEEFAEVCEWFAPAALASDDRPSVVLDLSCGTGLMARRLAGARAASTRLIAADYSESMLLETKRRFVEADVDLELYRVDVAKLPFQTASLDAVHAGAALHCWVELEAGLAEIARALKPGGKAFFTTFLVGAMGTNRVPEQVRRQGYRFFTVEELETLMADAGFGDVDVRREDPACAVIKCTMPEEDA